MNINNYLKSDKNKDLDYQNPKIDFTYKELWHYFKRNWNLENDCLVENETVIENLKPLFYYFSEDHRFYECKHLLKSKNTPSFDKGLLIIGSYGVGKSRVMQALGRSLQGCNKAFMSYHAMEVVDEFERCKNPGDKESFNKKYLSGYFGDYKAKPKYFDDIKTEREASNYGKINLFKDIFEKRYANNVLTHVSCNYHPDYEGDINKALDEFQEKYGARVYDRIFSMFNIIEFKGESFRK